MSAAYMRMFWGDFLKNTMHLTSAEVGVYCLLIAHYFEQGSLPDDDRRLARIARLPVPNWKKMRPTMEDFFEPGWRHARVDEEIAESRKKADRASRNARTRWNLATTTPIPDTTHGKEFDASITGQKLIKTMDDLCDSIATAMPQPCSSESESESVDSGVSRARPKTRDEFLRMEVELREAAGLEASPAFGLCDLSYIGGLIDRGFDFEIDILPAIRATKRGASVSTWKFFEGPILRAKANREAGMTAPLPSAATSSARVKSYLPVNWDFDEGQKQFAQTCGLREEQLNTLRQEIAAWGTTQARDDWDAQIRGKIAAINEQNRKAKADAEERETIKRDQEAKLSASMARYRERASG